MILKKAHVYFQIILKAPAKYQKDQPKTVEVMRTGCIHPIHFCGIRPRKKSVKNVKVVTKNDFRILKQESQEALNRSPEYTDQKSNI